jgi:predicted ATPase
LRDRRSEPITFLQTFDRAGMEPNCIRRSSAAVVSQSLAMLNSRFANAMAERFANRVAREATAGTDDQIRRAYLIVCNRLPTETETTQIGGFLASQATRYREAGADTTTAATSALVDFCQVLLASNEFLYVR